MKKTITLLSLLLVLKISFAQDTTHLDVGRLHLNKNFAIIKTIHAKDFENLPADDLQEVIKSFFLGTLTDLELYKPKYIVDGSIRASIKGYSLFDIESISLIQNTAVSSFYRDEQFGVIFLIRTKRALGSG